ncbi:MAG: hypothetical protein K2X86_08885 [Cytophagaceae bacterium]|nr:hypothetical protein [Cytophagaceae bacterium]
MIRVTEDTEKEFFFSSKMKEEKQSNMTCFVNGIEYSFSVVKGSKTGKKIVRDYKKKYSDLKKIYSGAQKDFKIEIKK